MKIFIYGSNTENITKVAKQIGFELVKSNPDVILSYGGDGALLSSERLYPGIPKLPIRHDQICKKCAKHRDKVVLEGLLNNKLKLKEYRKLSTSINGKSLYALNDFIIRNVLPMHTIRFKIIKNNKTSQLYIGDGVVAATPFGSTGYYQSITRKAFDKGFGLAFNNVTKKVSPIHFNHQEEVSFKLARGQAVLVYDNNDEIINISEGQQLTFKQSDQVARIYDDTSLRCTDCKINRD